MKLSIILLTYNSESTVEATLKSIRGLWNELLVSDQGSTDNTISLLSKYSAQVISLPNLNLGQRKQYLLERAKGFWVLLLDSDEIVSAGLRTEILKIISRKTGKINGFRIPYQNFVFGSPVYYGGERYSKIRFFKKEASRITPLSLHEEVVVVGPIGRLRGVIDHHSYRNPTQLYRKFNDYARIAAKQKYKEGESITFTKLFLYGPHMFWARFIEDKGWQDGWRGLVLALSFAYLENLTYWRLLLRKIYDYE